MHKELLKKYQAERLGFLFNAVLILMFFAEEGIFAIHNKKCKFFEKILKKLKEYVKKICIYI